MFSEILMTKNLRKYFGSVRAVDNVNFSIKEGEIIALVGPNGAGKTTLVNLISGYLKPDNGRIIYMGKDITKLSAVDRTLMGIGRSFQLPALFEKITVFNNVQAAILSIRRKTRNILKPIEAFTDINEEVTKLLKMFGLEKKATLLPSQLPEGDRKLLDVAIAFGLKPKLLLLDEPTSGVSTKDKFKVMDILVSALKEMKTTALIVEHDMDIVENYSDKVAVMHDGKIIATGKPNEVLEYSSVREVLFGG